MTSVLLSVSFAVLISGCEKPRSTTTHLSRADTFISQGKYREANIEFKNALQSDPNNPSVRWALGKFYLNTGAGESAVKELSLARELGVVDESVLPPLARAYLLAGRIDTLLSLELPASLSAHAAAEVIASQALGYAFRNLIDQAFEMLDRALAKAPQTAYVHMALGSLELARHNHSSARMHLQKALQLEPDSAQAWSLRGRLERLEEDLQSAEKSYSKAIAARVNNSADLVARAQVRIQKREITAARRDIERLRNIVSKSAELDYTEGLAEFFEEHFDKAQALFNAALRINPTHLNAMFYSAVIHYRKDQLNQAYEKLIKFVLFRPNHPTAAKMLALLKMRMNRPDETQKLLQPVLKRDPQDEFALNLMGVALLRLGETEEGLRYLTRLTELQPSSAKARTRLGSGLITAGEEEPGLKELVLAVDLDPEYREASLMLVTQHLKRQDYRRALLSSQDFAKRHPDVPEAYDLQGLAYLGAGDTDRAAEVLRHSLQIAPSGASANHNLATLAIARKAYSEAHSYYKAVLDAQPKHLRTLIKLAELHALQGDEQKMRSVLQSAIDAHPTELQPRLILGKYFLHRHLPEKASAVLTPIREQHKTNAHLLALAGEAELMQDPLAARATFRTLVSLAPASANAHHLLGRSLLVTGALGEALNEFSAALELAPNHPLARIERLKVNLSLRDTDASARDLAVLEKTLPENPEVKFLSGLVQVAQGRQLEAAKTFAAVIKEANTQSVLLTTAHQWIEVGEQDAGLGLYRNWLLVHTGDVTVRLAFADALAGLGDLNGAVSQYQAVLTHAPENIVALNNLAWYLRSKEPAQALMYAEAAYRRMPNSPGVLDTLSVVLAHNGQYEKALRYNDRAMALRTIDDVSVRIHRAELLVSMGKREDARVVLRGLLTLDESLPERAQAEKMLAGLRD